jgi:hypothetical protein
MRKSVFSEAMTLLPRVPTPEYAGAPTMRIVVCGLLLLIASCNNPDQYANPEDWTKPKATTENYRGLAESILDATAALSSRLPCMEGFRRPDRALDAEFTHRGEGVSFRGRMALSEIAENRVLPIRLGQLRISIVAEGPQAEVLMEAVRELAQRAWNTFYVRFDP